jgi:large subunit ribosomal protein L4
MATVKVIDMEGKETGTMELSDELFGIEPNENAVHEVVKNYLANQRQGTQSAKTRGEVRGGGRKPFRQKGTGRHRQGSSTDPSQIGGGVVFAPKPRDYSYAVPKKVRRLALKSALSSKFADSKMIVVEDMNLSEVKTAAVAKALKDLGAGASSLVVLEGANKNAELSARNIKDVKTAYVNTINVFDILKYDSFIATKAAVEKIEEVYK